MFSSSSKVFVSTKNYEYTNISIHQLIENLEKKESLFALSLHTGYKKYNFVSIDKCDIIPYEGTVVELEFVNTKGNKFSLTVTPDSEFLTVRGYISTYKINEMDVFWDSENLPCRLINKTFIENQNIKMTKVTTSYNNNLFCNDILIRSN